MAAEWNNLTTQELIDLYKDKAGMARNNENKIPLPNICVGYQSILNSCPPSLDKVNLYFINTLTNSIYSYYENSLLIKSAVEGKTEINKSQVLNSIGLLGIMNMNKENSSQILILVDCVILLFRIYTRNNNCDLSGLLSILMPNDQNIIQEEPPIMNTTSQGNMKFNNVNEYYQFLCDKLNENGCKYQHIMTGELCSWEVDKFFMTTLTTNHPYEFESFKFLKDNGYFNLGICPNCGSPLNHVKYTFTSGFNPNINYPICENCYRGGRQVSINPASDKKGCYIATVCYGDFNSTEVVLFRKYRDEVLYKKFFGRIFIRIYYFLSPTIANYLKDKRILNSIIRLHFLDKIYQKLTKRYV